MRVGIFTECYHPVLNGVVVSVDTFKDELKKRGHQFYIVTTKVKGFDRKDDAVFRVPALISFEPKGGRYPIAKPQNANVWAKKLASLNLDIIHSQHLLSLGVLGLKVAKKLNIPAVLTYHTLLTEYVHYVPIFGSLVRSWIIQKSRIYGNQYNAIVTPSPSMKELLLQYGVKTPITSIPTGIEPANFSQHFNKQELITKFQIPPEHNFLFLYVSRVGKEKNVGFLLHAMKRFVFDRNHHDAHLLMVGGGDELEKIKKEARVLGLKDYITFAGPQPKKETNKIFGGADVFVFASVTETQGIIIQEAQASGLPVIAVNVMGPSNYIKDNDDGFLVPLNIDRFVDKMEYLMANKNVFAKMREAAKENVKEYTAKASGDKMETLYERTIKNYNRT